MHRVGASGGVNGHRPVETPPDLTKVNVRIQKSQVTCLLLAVLEGIVYWKASNTNRGGTRCSSDSG
jgi:hypothetical protein